MRVKVLLLGAAALCAGPADHVQAQTPPPPVSKLATPPALAPKTGQTRQPMPIEDVARGASSAWGRHDIDGVLATSPRVLIRLPGADPSAALSRVQAAALLQQFVDRSEEVLVAVRGAREVQPGVAYVELERRFRVPGSQDTRSQTLLLSYRQGEAGWSLVELRVVGD